MVSKRFIVACAAVAVVTLIGQDDNDHSNEKSALVMVCTVIIAAITTHALVDCLFTLFSSSYSCSEIETIEDDHASSLHHNDETTPSSPNIKWTKPEFGWVKMNVDGSRDHISHPRSSGCGGVLRDASGKWLLGFAQKLDPSFEIHQAELEAILNGLEVASDMDVEKVVVESDSEPAVSMVVNGLGAKYNHKQFDIISRIRELRLHPKWEVKVVHVPKKANRVADRLAKDARDLPFEHLEKYPCPPAKCSALVEEDAQ